MDLQLPLWPYGHPEEVNYRGSDIISLSNQQMLRGVFMFCWKYPTPSPNPLSKKPVQGLTVFFRNTSNVPPPSIKLINAFLNASYQYALEERPESDFDDFTIFFFMLLLHGNYMVCSLNGQSMISRSNIITA